ncbi:hypothetical protein [Paenibacillus herberti]|uniref:Uncharacterized protein n=1 Tax=Paenibacillus herberti TaxID=1619309 RepID=A0A229NXJ2_9BACL|nr:hypothetical protein [Paenibacillus herberti]OXM14547.1 hypothetical protein CGZ75_16570 [Paenibacillus herberti]
MSEEATFSRYSGSRIGMVLVLFILLVIVTSMFKGNVWEDDPPVEAAVKRFQIVNTTSVYTFNLVSPKNIPTLPTSVSYARSSELFTIQGTETAEYDIRNSGVKFGTFSFTMNGNTGITGASATRNFSAYIDNNNFYAYTLRVYNFA